MTSLEFYAVGTHLVVDMPFASALTLAFVLFFAGANPRGGGGHFALLLAGVASGAAFLTKGPLGLLLPALVITGYLAWERRLKELPRLAGLPLLGFVACAAPWSLLVQFRDPGFWHYFIVVEHLHRFVSDAAQHRQPFWFLLPVFVGGALPWSLTLPATTRGLRRVWRDAEHQRSVMRYCICWFALPFLFFSLSQGKLATYLLPLFPAFAVLTGMGLPRAIQGANGRWFRRFAIVGAVITAATGAAVLAMLRLSYDGVPIFQDGEGWKSIVISLFMFGWALCFIAAARTKRLLRALVWFFVGPALVLAAAPWLIPSSAITATSPSGFLEQRAQRIDDNTIVVSDATMIHAVLWQFGRDDVFIIGGGSEFEYGMSFEDQAYRSLAAEAFAERLRGEWSGKRVIVIARPGHLDHWSDVLPKADVEVREGRYGWAEFKPPN